VSAAGYVPLVSRRMEKGTRADATNRSRSLPGGRPALGSRSETPNPGTLDPKPESPESETLIPKGRTCCEIKGSGNGTRADATNCSRSLPGPASFTPTPYFSSLLLYSRYRSWKLLEPEAE